MSERSTNRARISLALVSGTFLCLAFLRSLRVVQESEHIDLGGGVFCRKTLRHAKGGKEKKHTVNNFPVCFI